MKRLKNWIPAALLSALAAIFVIKRERTTRKRIKAWQGTQKPALDVLACPACHGNLEIWTSSGGESYRCQSCALEYPVIGGIPHFIEVQQLGGQNRNFSIAYNWFSWVYRVFSKMAFFVIGMPEEQGRREITDRLNPRGGKVLEVSIGPGVNLPFLVCREDVGEIFGLDISPGQLNRCREYVAGKGWKVWLQLGNAENLPYHDETFSAVFHIGGINFFDNKKQAIDEMIRVAKPGARILICDETEKGAQAYTKVLPGFKKISGDFRKAVIAPVDLVPPGMEELRVFDVWKGWMYCIEFRKPGQPSGMID